MTESLAFVEFNGHRLAAAVNDAGGRDIVVFCHGFGGQKTGPQRLFVRAARLLAERGISSIRFDQYGCGDSPGDAIDRSFTAWVATTRAIVEHYVAVGYRVALFGQSMGALTAIVTAASLPHLVALVAWSTGANIDPPTPSATGVEEEGGQLVRDAYWREAYEARVGERLSEVTAPAYLVFGIADHFVAEADRLALIERAQPQHRVDVFDGLAHSAWSFERSTEILDRSCHFLEDAFRGLGSSIR